jgi:hypothetical protein
MEIYTVSRSLCLRTWYNSVIIKNCKIIAENGIRVPQTTLTYQIHLQLHIAWTVWTPSYINNKSAVTYTDIIHSICVQPQKVYRCHKTWVTPYSMPHSLSFLSVGNVYIWLPDHNIATDPCVCNEWADQSNQLFALRHKPQQRSLRNRHDTYWS